MVLNVSWNLSLSKLRLLMEHCLEQDIIVLAHT